MSEKKYALLIASFEYDDSYFRRLTAPAQDVDALSRVLRDPAMGGFCDVKILLNEPKDRLVLGIEDFFDNRNREDLLLLYFSGHGVKDEDGRLYFATRNTLHNRLVATAVPAYQVNDLIGKCRSRRKILLLDCCYSGAFSKAFLAKGDQTVGLMEEFRQGQGLVTLTASDALQYSYEGEEIGLGAAPSVFTRALVEGIETGKADKDGDQLVSLDELYHYAYDWVRGESPQQTPRRSGEVEGDIIFARNPQPPRSAELPSKLQEAIESPIQEVREGIVRTLDTLLRGRNKGLALAAREALLKLKEDDSRRVASAAEKCLNASDDVQRRSEEETAPLRAGQERLARQTTEAGRQAAEEVEAEQLAQEKAEQEKRASEKANQERMAKEKFEAERLAREKAEQEQRTREKSEAARQAGEKLAEDRAARKKAKQERRERGRAEAARRAEEKVAAERAARETVEQALREVENAKSDMRAGRWQIDINAYGVGSTMVLDLFPAGQLTGQQSLMGIVCNLQGQWSYDPGARLLVMQVTGNVGGLFSTDVMQIQLTGRNGDVLLGQDSILRQYAMKRIA